jgi:hypothetical protein
MEYLNVIHNNMEVMKMGHISIPAIHIWSHINVINSILYMIVQPVVSRYTEDI